MQLHPPTGCKVRLAGYEYCSLDCLLLCNLHVHILTTSAIQLSACIFCTCACKSTGTIQMQDRKDGSLVPRPTSQLRMDYITATRIVGLVSSCTNFCPVAPECWSDQSDLRYAYSSYQSKLSDISYGGKARDG